MSDEAPEKIVLLTRDQIVNAQDLETRDVEVPEWGGWVRVKALTGRERDEFEQSTVETRGNKVKQNLTNFRAKLVALTVVDTDGHKVFSKQDVAYLGLKSAAALQRVFNAAAELSGMSDKDVEELTEDFDNDPNEPSITD